MATNDGLPKGRKSDTTPIKEVIEELFKSYHIDRKFNQTRIISTWEKITNKTIAKRTNKIFFKNNVMFVEFSSAPLKNEISLKKSKLLHLLQKEFGKDVVEELIIL